MRAFQSVNHELPFRNRVAVALVAQHHDLYVYDGGLVDISTRPGRRGLHNMNVRGFCATRAKVFFRLEVLSWVK